jgi:hypothetical protein
VATVTETVMAAVMEAMEAMAAMEAMVMTVGRWNLST